MRTTARTSRKRKVAQIVSDLSEEEPRPKKKQKVIAKPVAAPKKKKIIQKLEESYESEEDISDVDVPKPKNSKKRRVDSDSDDGSDYGDMDYDYDKDVENWDIVPLKGSELEDLKAAALKKLLASADASAYQSLGEEEYTMPDELLLQIFAGLPRKQLHQVGLTCRQWLRLTNDKSLGWYLAHSLVLLEEPIQYVKEAMRKIGERWTRGFLDQRQTAFDQMRDEEEKNATIITHKINFLEKVRASGPPTKVHAISGSNLQLLDEDDHVVRYATVVSCRLSASYNRVALEWQQLNSDPDLWSYRIRKASEAEVKQLPGYEGYENAGASDHWIVDLEINITRLEKLIANSQEIPGKELIFALVESDFVQRENTLSSAKGSSIPRRSLTAQQQPEGFKDEIKLYKYQLDAIAWMRSVEDNKEGLPYFTAHPWRRAKTTLLFDLENSSIVDDVSEFVDVAVPKGGVLADEMGLGKTTEIIGLMLASPPPEKLPEHRALIASCATLVLCPNHLVTQWSDELAKTTRLKVAVAATIVQLRRYSYQDFIDYDVVIVSYQMFENPNYFFLGSDEKKKTAFSITRYEATERTEWIKISLEKVKRSKKGMANTCPILEHFYWHRVVVDEGHEYLIRPHLSYPISMCFSKFAWYVTGTPFPTREHYTCVKQFLGIENKHKIYSQQQSNQLTDLMLRELYWRHTKVSVQGEYKVPDYVEDLVLVEFDPIEKALYADARQEEYQSRFCGTLFQKSTLDNRLALLIQSKTGNISSIKKYNIPNGSRLVDEAQRHYQGEADPVKKAVALNMLEHRKRLLDREQEDLEHHKKVLEIALKAIPFEKRDKKKFNEFTKLTETHGTKLVQMIVYLQKLFDSKPDSRVIFFSQFDNTLTKVSEILKEYGILNVFVEGKQRPIKNFKKNEDVKVIMLSLKSAASGTNLVEATHIILMDPMTGSKKEAQAIESQAIGRAYRQGQSRPLTVVRFIVQHTIEHVLYLRNNDKNDGATVLPNRDNRPYDLSASGSRNQ